MHLITEIRLLSPTEIEVEGVRYACRIGRAGLAAAGAKREGDLMTPRGKFPLRELYYRPDRIPNLPETGLSATKLTEHHGWCDDPAHPLYNRPVMLPFAGRHEKLWREDHVYDLIIPMGYNDGVDNQIIPGAGSAIFMHAMRPDGVGTEGCIAVQLETLLALLPQLSAATLMNTQAAAD